MEESPLSRPPTSGPSPTSNQCPPGTNPRSKRFCVIDHCENIDICEYYGKDYLPLDRRKNKSNANGGEYGRGKIDVSYRLYYSHYNLQHANY